MSHLFNTFTLNITKDNIPEGTDPLVLEIYGQLMDLYTSELEFWYDIEKASKLIQNPPTAPRWVEQPPFVPPTPYIPYPPPIPADFWPKASGCPKCGIDLNHVMGYCCPNMECPTGLGPVWCKTNV